MSFPVRRPGQQPSRCDPFAALDDIYSPLQRWLEHAGAGTSGWTPPADLEETEQNYLVHAELPGLSRENIALELDERELEIRGETPEPQRSGTLREHSRRIGQFNYRLRLPGSVDADNVSASLQDGVLTVTLPKTTQTKGRHIDITEH